MTLDQGLAFGLVALTIGAFIWGRFRYDVIAICALLAGVATGVVPAKSAFDGFSNDITVIIAAALVVSAAFAKSGIVEAALRPLIPRLKTERSQVPVLTAAVTILSTATKNVGALAILMPVALQLSRRTGSSPSRLLMPMAFGAMLGGIVTLVGTAPNIIVSQVREELLGKPLGANGSVAHTSQEFAALLLDEGHVAAVPGEAFGAPGYLRFSYALSDEDLAKGMRCFKEWIG